MGMEALLARLRELMVQSRITPKVLVLAIGVIAILVIAVNTVTGGTTETVARPRSTATSIVKAPTFYVHIVGEVKTPGVYALEVGSRLFDAVIAAGGFQKDADQASVNLARQLTDGEQVLVLKLGDAPSAGAESARGAGQTVSLNRATQAELEALPGVGPKLAGRIIDWRQANGGFMRKEDLLKVGGIGQKLFAGLSKLVGL